MKTVIVYYSMGGNTDFAAREIAARLGGAALLRLEPVKAYPDSGFRKFLWGGKSAVMAETPKLRPYDFPADCEQVVLGFPVWASNLAPPLRTFVRDNAGALRGKRLAAFACQGGSGAEKALGRLRSALGVDSLRAELILIDPKDRPSPENAEKLDAFCAALEA